MGSECPRGYVDVSGVCYKECDDGYIINDQGLCVLKCPLGWTDSNGVCEKPPQSDYHNGVGFATRKECENVAGVCYSCKSKFYPLCHAGYGPSSCDVCTPLCQDGQATTNTYCSKILKKSDDQVPTSLSIATIYLILTLIIVALAIFLTVLTRKKITSEQVFDIEYGVPGKSDAYAIITGKRASAEKFFI